MNNEKINSMSKRLKTNIDLYKKTHIEKLQQKICLLETLSPLSVIARGYSVTLDMKGKSIKSIKETHQGQKLQVKMIMRVGIPVFMIISWAMLTKKILMRLM